MIELCCEYLPALYIWLYFFYHLIYVVQSELTLYSCLKLKESLSETGAISEVELIGTGIDSAIT